MKIKKRRKTPSVKIGNILMGCQHPIVIQSMTDTPASDVKSTVRQMLELIKAGSEMVRLSVNDDAAARSIPEIIKSIRKKGYFTPIIGDFHFNGHLLLNKYPECAALLDKYRINPGNVGKGKLHDKNFADIIRIAVKNDKAVRIGINQGSLDQEMLAKLTEKNAALKKPKKIEEIVYTAMIRSALQSAGYAMALGLKKEKIVLSVKMSCLQDMVNVYCRLAKECDYALHLGLTEAGGDLQGIVSSSAALAVLLQQGIGDTIRISLTPQPNVQRAREVDACKALLQAMELRSFSPTVTSCPGCGRTNKDIFQPLARDIREYVKEQLPGWIKKYAGIEGLKIAVMGCVVNGPGESRYADIGISLPGASESFTAAIIYEDGKKRAALKGGGIKNKFIKILEEYIRRRYL